MIHYFTSKVNEESFYSDIIKNIDFNENVKRTLFGMLCLSKYYDN